MVGLVGKLVKKMKIIDKALVSTDSDRIGKTSQKYGLDYFFKRPKNISGDIVSDFKLEHALKTTEKILRRKFDIIIFTSSRSPLRDKI